MLLRRASLLLGWGKSSRLAEQVRLFYNRGFLRRRFHSSFLQQIKQVTYFWRLFCPFQRDLICSSCPLLQEKTVSTQNSSVPTRCSYSAGHIDHSAKTNKSPPIVSRYLLSSRTGLERRRVPGPSDLGIQITTCTYILRLCGNPLCVNMFTHRYLGQVLLTLCPLCFRPAASIERRIISQNIRGTDHCSRVQN